MKPDYGIENPGVLPFLHKASWEVMLQLKWLLIIQIVLLCIFFRLQEFFVM